MKKIIPFPEDPDLGPNNLPGSVIKVLDDQPLRILPQRDIELLSNFGIHQNYANALAQGLPFGAVVLPHLPIEKGRTRMYKIIN